MFGDQGEGLEMEHDVRVGKQRQARVQEITRELITSDRPLLVNVGEEPQRPIHAMTIALAPTKLFAFASFPAELSPAGLAHLPIAHTIALVVRSASEFLYSMNEINDGAHVGSSIVNVRTMMERAWRVTCGGVV